jgi:hypothetical protein
MKQCCNGTAVAVLLHHRDRLGPASALLERAAVRPRLRLSEVLTTSEMESLASALEDLPRVAEADGVCTVCGRRTVGKRYCSHPCNKRYLMMVTTIKINAAGRRRHGGPRWRDPDHEAMSGANPPGAARWLKPPSWASGLDWAPCVVIGSVALLGRHGVRLDSPPRLMVVAVRSGVAVVSARRLVRPHDMVHDDIKAEVGWGGWVMPAQAAEAYRAFAEKIRKKSRPNA